MYAKLFSKILDSSVWLEAVETRIVWVTMLAAMDDSGFVAMATPVNVARRANVSLDAASMALAVLEAPDPNSSDPEQEGRRLERVPGGWLVRNAEKYRSIATRADERAATRERVRRHRERRRPACNAAAVTPPLAVTKSNGSEADPNAVTEADGRSRPSRQTRARAPERLVPAGFDGFWKSYPRHEAKQDAIKAWRQIEPDGATQVRMVGALEWQRLQPGWLKDRGRFIPLPASWLRSRRWEDEPFHPPAEEDQLARVLAGRGRVL
jgi:hypothetical protein